jgi:hypothetical protein
MSSMFPKHLKILHLVIALLPIIMFSLNFILISFLLRIESRGKHSSKVNPKEDYPLPNCSIDPTQQVLFAKKVTTSRWHSHLGHPSSSIVRYVLSKYNLTSTSDSSHESVCDACQEAKSHQLPYPMSSSVSTAPLDLIFSDVWGPACNSISNNK